MEDPLGSHLDFHKLLDAVRLQIRPQPPPTFFQRLKNFFSSSPTMDSSYRSLVDIGLRLCLVAVSAYISARIISSVLDPDADQKKRSKRTVAALMKSLGMEGKSLQLTEHEMLMATQLVQTSETDQCWDDIGGQDELIKEISDTLVLPLRMKASASSLLAPPKGVLLYGPPGCGKTLIAKALAKATGARFMNLQISSLTDKWYGESQKLTAALFSLAKKIQPALIFIDEIDSFLRSRNAMDHECTAMMKAQFMSLWDGFASDPAARVIIIGATNRPTDVDPAILRRMPARFHVKKPDVIQRQRILEVILRGEELEVNVDLSVIAEATEGCSGSDLREICRIAAIHRMKDLVASGEMDDAQRPLKLHELLEGVEKIKHTQIFDTWASRM